MVPLRLQQDPDLWSGCISGAWQEQAFLEAFEALGFEQVRYADRSEQPWRVVEGIEFRAVTLVGALPADVLALSTSAELLLIRRLSRSCSLQSPLANCRVEGPFSPAAPVVHQIDAAAHQTQRRQANGRRHPAHLPVATFGAGTNCQPAGGNRSAITNRRCHVPATVVVLALGSQRAFAGKVCRPWTTTPSQSCCS